MGASSRIEALVLHCFKWVPHCNDSRGGSHSIGMGSCKQRARTRCKLQQERTKHVPTDADARSAAFRATVGLFCKYSAIAYVRHRHSTTYAARRVHASGGPTYTFASANTH